MNIKFEEAKERLRLMKIRNNFASFINNLDAGAVGNAKAIQDQLKVYFADIAGFLKEAESIYAGYEIAMMLQKSNRIVSFDKENLQEGAYNVAKI